MDVLIQLVVIIREMLLVIFYLIAAALVMVALPFRVALHAVMIRISRKEGKHDRIYGGQPSGDTGPVVD